MIIHKFLTYNWENMAMVPKGKGDSERFPSYRVSHALLSQCEGVAWCSNISSCSSSSGHQLSHVLLNLSLFVNYVHFLDMHLLPSKSHSSYAEENGEIMKSKPKPLCWLENKWLSYYSYWYFYKYCTNLTLLWTFNFGNDTCHVST